jgi:hypothetical protein
MKAELTAKISPSGRIIECRMTGIFSEEDMLRGAEFIKAKADEMGGKRHIVIADMRGMKTVHPSVARHMGAAIGYQRSRGCVLCAHVSDDTVQRLQARRLARENSVNDDVTIEVDSIEEARRVAKAYEKFLDDPGFSTSIRDALSA